MKQDQFLNVIDRDEAERRFRAAVDLTPLDAEIIPLAQALDRVLAADVAATVDVPSFDRSNVDGYAVQAADTFGAAEETPRTLTLTGESIAPGQVPKRPVKPGTASPIATGAMIPRGADAVVMVEQTDVEGNQVRIHRPVAPGANISYAATDIGRGEVVLRRGEILTSRDTGVLAAIGVERVSVVRRPRVAILSTGNELLPPGAAMKPGWVYDSNGVILADAVRELGCEPAPLGIFPDDLEKLRSGLREALACDAVLLSGGTSKGEGDLSYRAVADLGPPGIVAHGVALKPGKPLCLAAVTRPGPGAKRQRTIPVVILPGFPASAIFTFHEFVAPVLSMIAGRRANVVDSLRESMGPAEGTVSLASASARGASGLHYPTIPARLPLRVNSERGRTEYLLVGLVQGVSDQRDWIAYPMGKGSGSVTAFSRADGFVIIPRQQEYLEAGSVVAVHPLSKETLPADLVVIGSHCVGLDVLLGRVHESGFRTKFLAVGSTAGLEAARRGECDIAGIHLLDANSGEYNRPFLSPGLKLVTGYRRMQGFVHRGGDARFDGRTLAEALKIALADANCILVNRNRGSGTRILLDELLRGARPPGYSVETRSHNSVVAAVAQGRADWGLAIETVARDAGLGFIPVREEHYDFVVPEARLDRPAVRRFISDLEERGVREQLQAMGFRLDGPPA